MMHLPILEPTQWELNNITLVMLTSDHPYKSSSIYDVFKVNVIFPNENGFDDELYK